MTKQEFDTLIKGFAYQLEKCKRGEITFDSLYECMKVQIGKEAFKEVQEIFDERIS